MCTHNNQGRNFTLYVVLGCRRLIIVSFPLKIPYLLNLIFNIGLKMK